MMVQVNVIPEKEKEFLQAVEYLSQEAKSIQGLKSMHLHKDIQEPTSFRLIEEWESEAYLNDYLSGEDFKVILGAIQILCRSSEINYTKIQKGEECYEKIKFEKRIVGVDGIDTGNGFIRVDPSGSSSRAGRY